jgi:hypothetical protein
MGLLPFTNGHALNKRDDDYKDGKGVNGAISSTWRAYKGSGPGGIQRKRLWKRLAPVVIVIVVLLYLFGPSPSFQSNQEPTYDKPPTESKPHGPTSGGGFWGTQPKERDRPPPHSNLDSDEILHYHQGPIKYYKLATTLHGLAVSTAGQNDRNGNILFAAANAKSAALLLPLACEMARWRRAHVHFALMGRDDITFDELLEINGIDDHCDVYWHGKLR